VREPGHWGDVGDVGAAAGIDVVDAVEDEAERAEMLLRPGGEDGGEVDLIGIVRMEFEAENCLVLFIPAPEAPAPDGGEEEEEGEERVGGAAEVAEPAAGGTATGGARVDGVERAATFGTAFLSRRAKIVVATAAVTRGRSAGGRLMRGGSHAGIVAREDRDWKSGEENHGGDAGLPACDLTARKISAEGLDLGFGARNDLRFAAGSGAWQLNGTDALSIPLSVNYRV